MSYIGQSVTKVDAQAKLTGKEMYGTDLRVQGLAHASVVRSPVPHGMLNGVGTQAALAVPGVIAVITAADIKGTNLYGDFRKDQRVLIPVGERVKFVGDPVAVVVAETEAAARSAATLVELDIDELPALTSPDAAIAKPFAIHEEVPDNVCFEREILRGDAEQGLAEADLVVRFSIETPRQDHTCMEPEGGIAIPTEGGGVEVHCGVQTPLQTREHIATSLGIPESHVRIVGVTMGGAFGRRIDMSVHPHLALAALHVQRPVRYAWTSEESFLVGTKRHPARAEVEIGAKSDGKITALRTRWTLDGGAYTSQSANVLGICVFCSPGPYDIPHVDVKGRVIYTNNPISGGFRGFGGPQAVLSIETAIGMLAEKLDMDPVQLRLRNFIHQYTEPAWQALNMDDPVTLPTLIDKAQQLAGPVPAAPAPGWKVGRGIACSLAAFDISGGAVYRLTGTGVDLEMNPDGSAIVRCEAVEYGTGIPTMLMQICATELGIPMQAVNAIIGDTSAGPKSGRTVASRATYCLGNALLLATAAMKRKLAEAALEMRGIPVSEDVHDATFVDGEIHIGEFTVPIAEVTRWCVLTGVDIHARGWFKATHAGIGHTYLCSLVDLAVDEELGSVKLLQTVTVHDVGKALNPEGVRGQLIGGELQGLGYALMEDQRTDGGYLVDQSLLTYAIPTVMDTAEKTIAAYIETPYESGPYGGRGVGEHAIDDPAAAVVAAIHDATGVWITKLPATAERVWEALQAKSAPVG